MNQIQSLQQQIDFLKGRLAILEFAVFINSSSLSPDFRNGLVEILEEMDPATIAADDSVAYRLGMDTQRLNYAKTITTFLSKPSAEIRIPDLSVFQNPDQD